MKASIMSDYAAVKNTVKARLAAAPGKIALTTDAWTAGNGDQFLCLTAHWIDERWKLGNLLLD
ncbi:unnamed protein product, partial [Tilletia laevis]